MALSGKKYFYAEGQRARRLVIISGAMGAVKYYEHILIPRYLTGWAKDAWLAGYNGKRL